MFAANAGRRTVQVCTLSALNPLGSESQAVLEYLPQCIENRAGFLGELGFGPSAMQIVSMPNDDSYRIVDLVASPCAGPEFSSGQVR